MWNWAAMEIASCGLHWCSRSGVGTWGAFVGLVIQLIFIRIAAWQMALVASVALVIGLIVTRPAEELMVELYGPRKRHTGEIVEHDLNQNCFDEVVGQLIAGIMVVQLWSDQYDRAVGFLVAFLVFRVLDIRKPWPIKKVEKMFGPGSARGIVLDDAVAGVMTWLALVIVKHYFPTFGIA